MARFTGQSVIVTGAASGIGRSAAKQFAAEGASVLASDINEDVNQTVEEITKDGGTAIAVVMDAGDEAQVEALVAKAVQEFGKLDVAFANAGISGGIVGFGDQTAEDWARILRVNLIGPFLMAKYASKVMVPQGKGSIVCTASVAGIRSGAGGSPYSASKAGVISLVQTIANQLYGTGVRINAVCPGLIETGMTKRVFDRAAERGTTDKLGQLNPLRRAGQPNEIANMALFLASDEASYVNGQAIAVDGGLSSSHPIVPPRPGKPSV